MFFDDHDHSVRNPLNDFYWGLPLEKCGDEKLDWLLKNLTANFYKLFNCANQIEQVQRIHFASDGCEFKAASGLNIEGFGVVNIEYFFIKVGTIIDLCYQAFDRLWEIKKAKKNETRHETLSREFEQYNTATNSQKISYSWYNSINKIRNRIVHGGFSIKAYSEDDRILFQAYDASLNEKIVEDYGFFKKDRPIIFADFYTNFYTHVIHWYIEQFFQFILHKLGAKVPEDSDMDEFDRMMKNSHIAWEVGDVSEFKKIAVAMAEYNKD